MRENNGSYYARMGIWGEPTSITPIPIKSTLDTAFDRMNSVQNMFGKQYDNIIKKYQSQDAGLQNQYNQSTLQGRVGAENTKNQTDMQYYPQMQQAKLAQDQQTVNEIMSRTGLNRAQATEAAARTGYLGAQTQHENAQMNPGYMYDSIKKQMEASPMGSPRRSYFGGILANMMNSSGGQIPVTQGGGKQKNDGMMATGMVRGSSTSPGGAAVPDMPGLSVNPMTVSRSSNKGAEYAKTDDQGNTTVYTSPTTPMITNLQNRLSAEYELNSLDPVINQGIAPYISKKGALLDYPADLYKSSRGDKDAQQRIDSAESAQQMIAEKAILRIRQATPSAQIGPEMVNDMVKRMYPNLPSHFMRGFNSADHIANASENVDKALAKANTVAAQQVASNYPTPVNQRPVWDRGAQSQGWSFDPSSGQLISPKSSDAQPEQNSPAQNQGQNDQQSQPQIEQLNAMAQEAIKRGADPRMVQKRLQDQMQRLQGGSR
jgi:hypothetical protein